MHLWGEEFFRCETHIKNPISECFSNINVFDKRSSSSNGKLTFNFSKLNAGLINLLCLFHFSPSQFTRPVASNLASGFASGFRKSLILLSTSLISSGSVRVTLGFGPNQIKEFLPTYHQHSTLYQGLNLKINKKIKKKENTAN